MPTQVDPRYFQFGNAFLGGQQQAGQEQQRNAMLDMEQRQLGLQEQRYAQQEQLIQSQQQQGQTEVAGRAALLRHILADQPELLEHVDDMAQAPDSVETVIQWKKLQTPSASEQPSTVQEWEYFNKLPQADQARFMTMKRNPAPPQIAVIQGVPTIVERTPDRLGMQTPLSSQEAELGAAAAKETAVTGAGERAKVQVAAQADLPRQEANATEAQSVLTQLSAAPGFDRLFGVGSIVPIIPGTEQANAYAMWEQIQGKAFLEAFNSLKGGGQITEIEGQKATAAMTRLANRKQSPKAARAALAELQGIVQRGVERARRKASQGVSGPGRAPAGAAPSAPKRKRYDANGNPIDGG